MVTSEVHAPTTVSSEDDQESQFLKTKNRESMNLGSCAGRGRGVRRQNF